MAENQVYLIKSGQNSFVEETEAVVGISGGKVGIGTTTPEADLHVTGSVKVGGDLAVDGTFTTINSSTVSVDDKNIELGSTDSPTDLTADGGGITVKGATDKTFNWLDATDAWTSSEHLYLADGKHFSADELRALDGDGLKLSDQTASGVLIKGGKVGIHQATPVYDLDVDGSGNFASLYVGGNAVLTGEGSIFGKWEDGTSEGEIFYTGGNVGVGTDDPGHDFHVVGDSVVDGNFVVNGTSGNLNVSNFNVSGDSIVLNYLGQGLTNSRGGLIVKDSSDASKSLEYVEGSDFWLSSESVQIADGKELQTDKVRAIDAGGLSLQDDGGNGIFIEDGGQVGVNTSSPNYSLDVNGSAKIASDFYAGNAFKISAGGAVGDIAPASDGDIIKWDDTNNKWVAGANLGGGGGGGVGEVPLATIDSLPSGQSIYQIDFAETYNVEPRIATQLEIDGEGSIIPYVVSGVSTSGYHLIFAQDIPNNNYRIHTTFGGRDVHWETGAGASLYYNDGDVSIQRNFTIGGNLTVNGTTTTVNTETVEIEDHNLVIAANTGYNQLDSQYPAGGAYAGILWGTGDAGSASPVSLTYQTSQGFAFEGGNVGIGTTAPDQILTTRPTQAGKYGIHIIKPETNDSLGGIFVETDNTTSLYLKDRDASAGTSTIRLKAKGDTFFDGGNVGIGTRVPGLKLHVHSGADNDNTILESSDTAVTLTLKDSTGTAKIESRNDFRFSNNAGADEIMRLTADGKVGIGTTSPGSLLHVAPKNNVDADGATTNESYFKVYDNSTSGLGQGRNGGVVYIDANYYASTSDVLHVLGRGESKFVIKGSGNVGIGTTDPGAKLDVHGQGADIAVTWTDSTDPQNPVVKSSALLGSTSVGDGILQLYNADGTTSSRIRTDADSYVLGGNFGIGTTNINYRLDVKEAANNTYAARIWNGGGDSYGLLVKTNSGLSENFPILDLENVSSNVFRVQANGNVGIGTTIPGARLEIINTNTTTAESYGLSVQGGGNSSSTGYSLRALDQSGNVDFFVRGDGNVGIGTTEPVSILHVNKSVNTTNTGLTISNYDNTAGTNQAIRLDFGLARNSGALKPYAGRILVGKEDDWVSDDKEINSFMSFNVFEENAISEKMRITSNGNVGIGTTDPGTNKLDVQGTVSVGASSTSTSAGYIKVQGYRNVADQGVLGHIRFDNQNEGNTAGKIEVYAGGSTTTGTMRFHTSGSEKMRIAANGNVGIGTTNPGAPLEVDAIRTYDTADPPNVTAVSGGIIVPRMTSSERALISSPTDGEIIYNTTDNRFEFRQNGAWVYYAATAV
tara:strand:+ start:304 stop:4212 length:3909 start_codon:yes stop_codon:yes gene_type:complete